MKNILIFIIVIGSLFVLASLGILSNTHIVDNGSVICAIILVLNAMQVMWIRKDKESFIQSNNKVVNTFFKVYNIILWIGVVISVVIILTEFVLFLVG